jgi:hypothetical protein
MHAILRFSLQILRYINNSWPFPLNILFMIILKINVFWNVMCSKMGTNVSKEPAASIYRVEKWERQ